MIWTDDTGQPWPITSVFEEVTMARSLAVIAEHPFAHPDAKLAAVIYAILRDRFSEAMAQNTHEDKSRSATEYFGQIAACGIRSKADWRFEVRLAPGDAMHCLSGEVVFDPVAKAHYDKAWEAEKALRARDLENQSALEDNQERNHYLMRRGNEFHRIAPDEGLRLQFAASTSDAAKLRRDLLFLRLTLP